jgi:hypothetical protein
MVHARPRAAKASMRIAEAFILTAGMVLVLR